MNTNFDTDKASLYIFERAKIWNNPNPLLNQGNISGMQQTVRSKKPENIPSYTKTEELQKYYFSLYDIPNETSKYDSVNSRMLLKNLNKDLLYKF